MKTVHHTIIITIALLLFIFIEHEHAFAIGEFSIGLNAGLTQDPNHLEPAITQWNTQAKTTASDVDQISIPYSFVWGINVRYQFNYFLFRLAHILQAPTA